MAITRVDPEEVLSRLYTMVVAQLPTYITQMNTERTDLALTAIPTGGFFFQELPSNVNLNPWVLIGISTPVEVTSRGPAIANRFQLSIILGSAQTMGNTNMENTHRIFMRYTEAIVRCITKNFDVFQGFSLTEITQIPQAAEIETESGEVIRVAGVQMTAVIA